MLTAIWGFSSDVSGQAQWTASKSFRIFKSRHYRTSEIWHCERSPSALESSNYRTSEIWHCERSPSALESSNNDIMMTAVELSSDVRVQRQGLQAPLSDVSCSVEYGYKIKIVSSKHQERHCRVNFDYWTKIIATTFLIVFITYV